MRASLVALAVGLCIALPLRANTEGYRIYLVQPEVASVESWEFQGLWGAWEFIDASEAILDPSDACLAVDVLLPFPGFVRARSWDFDGYPSEWSYPIPAPEPSTNIGLSLGALALGLASRRRRFMSFPFHRATQPSSGAWTR